MCCRTTYAHIEAYLMLSSHHIISLKNSEKGNIDRADTHETQPKVRHVIRF